MGIKKENFTKNEIEMLYRVYREFLLEQEIIYGLKIPDSFYMLFEKLVKLKGRKK